MSDASGGFFFKDSRESASRWLSVLALGNSEPKIRGLCTDEIGWKNVRVNIGLERLQRAARLEKFWRGPVGCSRKEGRKERRKEGSEHSNTF